MVGYKTDVIITAVHYFLSKMKSVAKHRELCVEHILKPKGKIQFK
jgi:hypothetical protein